MVTKDPSGLLVFDVQALSEGTQAGTFPGAYVCVMLWLGMWLNVFCPCNWFVCALWVLGISSWASVRTYVCSPTPVRSQGRCWSHWDSDECANRAALTLCVSLFVSPPHACAKCMVKKSAFTEPRHSENAGTAEGE